MRQPKNPFHPGEILQEEFLEPAGITQMAFAKKLGWTCIGPSASEMQNDGWRESNSRPETLASRDYMLSVTS